MVVIQNIGIITCVVLGLTAFVGVWVMIVILWAIAAQAVCGWVKGLWKRATAIRGKRKVAKR